MQERSDIIVLHILDLQENDLKENGILLYQKSTNQRNQNRKNQTCLENQLSGLRSAKGVKARDTSGNGGFKTGSTQRQAECVEREN